jgi:DNA polymerase I
VCEPHNLLATAPHFSKVIVLDFEYESGGGGLPNVLCLAWHELDANLNLIRRGDLWRGKPGQPLPPIEAYRGEFGKEPPFDIGSDTLIVAYAAWAELMCFLVLGWAFPAHVFDLHTAYQAASNILPPYDPDNKRKSPGKSLADACRAHGIQGWEKIDKKSIAKDIGAGHWERYGKSVVQEYCTEDVRMSVLLLKAELRGICGVLNVLPPADVDRVLFWSEYSAKAIARIQSKGMPIDMMMWRAIQENKAKVIDALRREYDPSYYDDDPIYDRDGGFEYERFARWLSRKGIPYWPRTATGRLKVDGKTFKEMSWIADIRKLHILRDALHILVSGLPIGPDDRNRASLFPFKTLTSRNAHGKTLYNAHAGMRSLMVFPEDTIGLYLDWSQQEPAISATFSGDKQLIADYTDLGDVYLALARMCGLTDETDAKRWKSTDEGYAMRERMKILQLAINYGMSVDGLARGLSEQAKIYPALKASRIIELHHRYYPDFWAWRQRRHAAAMVDRKMLSISGWPMYLSHSPNPRTIFNFPAQSAGADCMRLAAVKLCEDGLTPSMLIHDGILLEVRSEEEVEHAQEVMRWAGREITGGLFDIRVGVDQKLVNGARYADKRPDAKRMWTIITDVLRSIKAIP